MKIFVLHGEDLSKSYERLKKFIETAKNRSWEVVYTDELPQSLAETVSGGSLFQTDRFFIVRNIKKLSKKDLEWLKEKSINFDGNLVIYNEGDLTAAVVKSLPKDAKIEQFALPKIIWGFLEKMVPGNLTTSLRNLHLLMEKDAPEFIFSLIAKQFRDMFWVKRDPKSLKLPEWRISKIRSQASGFSEEKLAWAISDLAAIDVASKTGKGNIVSLLDLFMVKILE